MLPSVAYVHNNLGVAWARGPGRRARLPTSNMDISQSTSRRASTQRGSPGQVPEESLWSTRPKVTCPAFQRSSHGTTGRSEIFLLIFICTCRQEDIHSGLKRRRYRVA